LSFTFTLFLPSLLHFRRALLLCPGLSQMQLQKSPEQHQKIPKSVVVQHKIGVRIINKIGVRKIELNIICKIN